MHDMIRRGANVDRSIKLKLERMRLSQGLPSMTSARLLEESYRNEHEATLDIVDTAPMTPYHDAMSGEPLYQPDAVDTTPPFSYIPPPTSHEGMTAAMSQKQWLPRSEFDKDLKPRTMQLGLGNDAERPLDERFKKAPYV